jgi:hypothetical protein
MKKMQFVILCALLSLVSCNQPTESKSENDTVNTEVEEANELDKPAEVKTSLTLNNGLKWPANPETAEGIAAMIELMNGLSEQENIEQYHLLGEELSKAFALIFEQCTMTGEAHNQLHLLLSPMQKMIIKIKSDELMECAAGYNDLKAQLALFEVYFVSE